MSDGARYVVSSASEFEERFGYARAVVDGDRVHVSGTTGFDYATMTISDDVVEQAEQCLRTIGAALAEAGRTFADGRGCGTCCPTGRTSSPAGRCSSGTSARCGPPPRCCSAGSRIPG
ncbi:Rid family hydrolase [Streptomyces sp. enrichment culture]|uniref:Rid family hydrolase n=1 Tax=Streptomyces sp. enrichment culture TaxID=1795815 RepID=UPI003F542F45